MSSINYIVTLLNLVYYNTVVCNEGDIRLCDSSGNCGTDLMNGRLEYCMNEAWGSVCNNMWSLSDATVACVQLGYSASGNVFVVCMLSSSKGPFLANTFNCSYFVVSHLRFSFY